jgi:SAM-dependent methyltransferase
MYPFVNDRYLHRGGVVIAMSRHAELEELYEGRKLSDRYPDLERLGVEFQASSQGAQAELLYTPAFMKCIDSLIDLKHGLKTALVVGCGPRPYAVRWLSEQGYEASGIEPVASSVESARDFLGDSNRVHFGEAEHMPVADATQRVILMESVLEHVDSPQKALAECFRVLAPGGVLFIYTTNRWKIRLSGYNGEYQVPFFNWFPDSVKESYIFQHLHYNPTLAQYNARPAFHWFSYPELCQLGRSAGFGFFYSLLDVVDLSNPLVSKSRVRRFLLNRVRYSPWLRGLALTQMGGSSIFMLKRGN